MLLCTKDNKSHNERHSPDYSIDTSTKDLYKDMVLNQLHLFFEDISQFTTKCPRLKQYCLTLTVYNDGIGKSILVCACESSICQRI